VNRLKTLLILELLGAAVETSHAWGPVGHETVALIAESYLSPAAKEKIASILGPNAGMADVSNWADSMRMFRPYTAPWHFIDLEVRQTLTEEDELRFCAKGDCVVDQIGQDIAVLKNPTADLERKQEALKFLIHFVGDVHQPLHCADDHDRGGNEKIVRYWDPSKRSLEGGHGKGEKIKLHAFWDRLLEIHTGEDPGILAAVLGGEITSAKRKRWSSGNAADWAWESYGIAKTEIFSEFSPGPTSDPNGVPLPEDYYGVKMKKIMDLQLEKAGVRLAYVLEDVFGP